MDKNIPVVEVGVWQTASYLWNFRMEQSFPHGNVHGQHVMLGERYRFCIFSGYRQILELVCAADVVIDIHWYASICRLCI